MNAVIADIAQLAASGGELPRYPTKPSIAELENGIRLFLGRRSDQTRRQSSPSSVFEIELDSEVQELQHLAKAMQQRIDAFEQRHKKTTTIHTVFYASLWAISMLVVGLVIFGFRYNEPKLTPQSTAAMAAKAADKVSEGSAAQALAGRLAPAPLADSSALAAVPVAGAASSSRDMVVPANVATAPTAKPDVELAQVALAPNKVKQVVAPTPASKGKEPPKGQPGGEVTVTSAVPTSTPNSKEEKIFALEDAKVDSTGTPARKQEAPPATPAERSPTAAPAKAQVDASSKGSAKSNVAAEDASPRDPQAKKGKGKALAPAGGDITEPAEEQAVAATASDGPPARRDKYGSGGVITLTPGAVVVFDKDKRVQRMVQIGGRMPDGSVLKGVDVSTSRIRTDKGDVVFD